MNVLLRVRCLIDDLIYTLFSRLKDATYKMPTVIGKISSWQGGRFYLTDH
jgi:hypothetical protein